MKYITIYVRLSKAGKEVLSTIIIRDGFSLTTFTDPSLAKQVYEYDLKNGEDVSFNKKHNAYIKRYGKISKEKIVKELKIEIKQAGGQIIQ